MLTLPLGATISARSRISTFAAEISTLDGLNAVVFGALAVSSRVGVMRIELPGPSKTLPAGPVGLGSTSPDLVAVRARNQTEPFWVSEVLAEMAPL